jgi:hypothetical protein
MTAMTDHLLPNLVYSLCALTSIACALLMLRSWRRSRQRLVAFVGLSFAVLSVNNVLLVADLWFIPQIDLALARAVAGSLAMVGLLFALIWEAR